MKRVLWFLLLLVALALRAPAAGLIIIHDEGFWRHPPPGWWPPPHPPIPPPHPPPPRPIPPPRPVPPPPPTWAPLEVDFTQVNASIKDQIATTRVEQEFYNPNARQLEGTFLFPVPKGAHVNKFTMEINGRPVEAELLAADKARGIYEDIVRRLRDPALLEYAGRDLFKVRIFPIEPHAKKRITLAYSQLLKADAGLVNFTFPLNTEKFSAKPLRQLAVKIEVESKRPLKAIYSPSHTVEVKRDGARKATVGFAARDVKPDADFQLFFSQEQDDLGVNLLTYKTTGEDGYFVLLASPGIETKSTKVIPKDVVFVLDTSGSMAGAKLEQAKKALAFCVENLNDGDRFEVLRFATEVEPLFNQLTAATKENRARAQRFISELKPIGGTAIDDALRQALAHFPARVAGAARPATIIFLTDGRPTIGTTDENLIQRNVADQNKATARIFCFGIGTDVNTHLLDRITEDTRAYSQYVLPEEDIEVKVSSFFTKVKDPVLASPKLTFPDAVRVTKLYPSPVPDLFKGEQLVLVGRYSGKGDGAIQIEGNVAGEPRQFAYDVKFPDEASDHEFIPRLWATRRVGYLLDEIRLRGESKELKDEVTELARTYNIVTPYTAYLIVEDEARRGVAANVRTLNFAAESEVRLRELRGGFDAFQRDKAGELAVSGARATYELKSANAPADAVELGRREALQGQIKTAPPGGTYSYSVRANGQASAPTPGVPAIGGGGIAGPVALELAKKQSQQYAQQAKVIAGRTFYLNGEQWIDAEVQKATNAPRVRVQFGSPEYFDLLKQHARAQAWFAAGRNVQLVLAGTVYEVYE
jgi:Ca-activated chloride channel family protein